ncbi:DUF3572 domain-containing protein [Aliiroseovarius marinus]|uniref:DUF3572 domain-containing protein n=1 Tax=Aliiroseovarius marinus TaxID=2500159 RepID=UPI003D7DADBA
MTPETAETFALQTLGWLISNDELLPVFMGSSGVDQAALKAGASDPAFLASVLDFIMMDDAWVIAACEALQAPYERPSQARQALPGGAQTHWT